MKEPVSGKALAQFCIGLVFAYTGIDVLQYIFDNQAWYILIFVLSGLVSAFALGWDLRDWLDR